MKRTEKDELKPLATQVETIDSDMEYHPSIRQLVKILARKAAEEHYEEFLSVVRSKYGEDIDK